MSYKDNNVYKNKTVLVTGHTGFKGTWLVKILQMCGANVIGYALKNEGKESLFDMMNFGENVTSIIGDIRDYEKLEKVIKKYRPEFVFHLAAQPIVRRSYVEPLYTYSTNVMGTVNLLEALRKVECAKSIVNVTTDKVYENEEIDKPYVEEDKLDGYDPYSNSKSCSELVTHSYCKSFFNKMGVSVSTARAGNVIGGGDFAENRILPDCIRAALRNEMIVVRNPDSIRPYQHVLEALSVYLMIAEKQYFDGNMAGAYNVGPDDIDCWKTRQIVECFCEQWGDGIQWQVKSEQGMHEASILKLDCSKLKRKFGWKPIWNVEKAIEKTVECAKEYNSGNVERIVEQQIIEFFAEKKLGE